MDRAESWEPVEGVREPDEEFAIDDLDLIADVTHDVRGALLRRLREPASVAELAEERRVPVTRLYHHVNRLADMGLVRVVATRRSGAVVERRYQAAARAFTLSDELLAETEPAILAKVLGSLFDVAKLAFQREVEQGALTDTPAGDRTILGLNELHLTDDRARDLTDQLKALLEEYRDRGGDGDPYLLFLSGFPSSG